MPYEGRLGGGGCCRCERLIGLKKTVLERLPSSLFSIRGPETNMFRLGIEPGLPALQVCTLVKSCSNSLLLLLFGPLL